MAFWSEASGNGFMNQSLRNTTDFMQLSQDEDGLKTNHLSTEGIIEGVTLSAILVLALLGNALVCYCGMTSRRAQAMNYFIVNAAMAEILLAMLVLPMRIQSEFTGKESLSNPNLCRLLQYFQTVCLGVVNITLLLIAIDRYTSIFLTPSKVTLRQAKYMIVVSWCLPLLVTSPIFFDLSGEAAQPRWLLMHCSTSDVTSHYVTSRGVTLHDVIPHDVPLHDITPHDVTSYDVTSHDVTPMNKFNRIYSLIQVSTISILPMCILYTMYFIMIARVLRIDALGRRTRDSTTAGSRKSPCGTFREAVPVAKRRALVMNFIVTSLFLFCWSPIVGLYTVQVIQGKAASKREKSLYDLLSYVALANLTFNPLVYCFFDSVFRSHVLCCLRYKRNPQRGGRAGHFTTSKEPRTEDKLTDLTVSKIGSSSVGTNNACADQEPLLAGTAAQQPSPRRPPLLSRDKLARLVCNTRRYRSLGQSRSSDI